MLPLGILVGGVFHAVGLQAANHVIQAAAPEGLEPRGMAKPFYDGGTEGIVEADKGPAGCCFGKSAVLDTAQRPDLRTVVGTVHTGGHIAAAGVVVVVAPRKPGSLLRVFRPRSS